MFVKGMAFSAYLTYLLPVATEIQKIRTFYSKTQLKMRSLIYLMSL